MPVNSKVQALLPGLNDNREGMRHFAVKKCAELGAEIVPDLVELLKEKEGYLADSAAHVLQLLGKPAIPELLKALDSSDRKLRWSIAAILSEMGPEAREAVDKARPISARMSSVE